METEWPKSVVVLLNSCNVSSYNPVLNWPNNLDEWGRYNFPDHYDIWKETFDLCWLWSNHLEITLRDPTYHNIITSIFPYSVKHWNYRLRLKFNLSCAVLGYTEEQDSVALALLAYLQSNNLYSLIKENPNQYKLPRHPTIRPEDEQKKTKATRKKGKATPNKHYFRKPKPNG